MATRPPPGMTDNLAQLDDLSEERLLTELRVRYDRDVIYSYVGEILVTVNPYKWISGLYSRQQADNYSMVTDKAALPPHLFAIADMAFQQLSLRSSNQSCVISGESGAGKTEAAKLFVQQLIHVCNGCELDGLHSKLVDVNPLLEAFGNAQTLMNDNSSRFGKFTEVIFNPKKGIIRGATIKNYLLEKSRVVHQGPGERNFHIFYLLFAGLSNNDERNDFELQDPFTYRCLNSNREAIASIRTPETFHQVRQLQDCLEVVGFTAQQREDLWGMLCGILHLANLQFAGEEAAKLSGSNTLLAAICNQLEVDETQLELALTRSVIIMRGEETERAYKLHEADDGRDAAVKAIYEKAFGWIIKQCNVLLHPKTEETTDRSIGILDIFGFECFEANGFEQLCINLANEQLQFFFNDHIFRMELLEYAKEGVASVDVTYNDNQPLLDLFLQPGGLVSLLDEESNFPKGSDGTFVLKLHKACMNHRDYVPPKSSNPVFSLHHYAGMVQYDANNFLEKNRDRLAVDIISMLRDSENPVLAKLFGGTGSKKRRAQRDRLQPNFVQADPSISQKRLHESMRRVRESLAKTKKYTVAMGFKVSLSDLMKRLQMTEPHFVRCIKPNEYKEQHMFESDFVTKQLRYTGMLETTRIRREGYSHRPYFYDFVRQYAALSWLDTSILPDRQGCEALLQRYNIEGYVMGKTKVFLRYWHVEKLNVLARPRMNAAIKLQKVVRGMHDRCAVRRLSRAAIKQEEKVTNWIADVERRGATKRDIVLSMTDIDSRRPLAFWARRLSKDAVMEPGENAPRRRESKMRQHNEAVRWYKEHEKDRGAGLDESDKREEGNFARWFHGVISRRAAEDLLEGQPSGTFLVRVAESRFGYSLSLIHNGEVKHFMIDLKDDLYILVGNRRRFKTLRDVVVHHKSHDVTSDGDLLIYPCDSEGERKDLKELV